MKLLHLSPVLCACLVACGEAETAANSTTSPDANAEPTMKTVSFSSDHGASAANDPKTGTVNPFGGSSGDSTNSDTSSPQTRIVERHGIDPKKKTINPFADTSNLTADGATPSATPGTRKVSETGKIKTGTVNPFGGKTADGKEAKLIADPANPTATPGVRKASEVGKVKTGTVTLGGDDKAEGKPSKSTKEKPSKDTGSKEKPSKDTGSKEKPTDAGKPTETGKTKGN
ncbi:MAG: hypothetical protein MK291_03760 [Planctomycetes bacterium]|nr:hypothetical protein [Planctomycetota bacterium]